jgi:hypothetical protein
MSGEITPELAGVVLAAFTGVVIPGLVIAVRSAIRWSRLESKVEGVIHDLKELISNKDNTHSAMLDQMKVDRDATDRRLRWLEEHLWRRERGNRAVRNEGN